MQSGFPPPDRGRSRTGLAVALTLAVVATAAMLVGRGGGGGDTGGKTTAPRLKLPTGTLVGAHSEGSSARSTKAAVESLEEHLGRTLDIDHNFYPWDTEFPTEVERWDLDHGRVPMISWNGRSAYASDIADGKHDPLITDRAERVKALGKPVLIRWFWEMDGKKKAEWAQSPDDYIAAWRHIHDVFVEEGATNVSWVWCPNASAFEDGEAQSYYPGAKYVDWLCADGYNWAPGRSRDRWRSFRDIFSGFYAWAAKQDKPIMVGEFGVQEGTSPGAKAAWIEHARNAIKNDFPLLRAIVYFDVNQDYDWRLSSSDASYQAFKELARDPWFNQPLKGSAAKKER